MTLSNNPNPADDRNDSRDPEQDLRDLSLPSVPRANHNRILVDAYFDNCKRGFLERNELITSPKEMAYEDRVSLAAMARVYRGLVGRRLELFGSEKFENEFTLRFLHPVVAVGKTRREHHLYVDIVSSSGRCSFVDNDAVAVFLKGPAAVQLSRIAHPGKSGIIITRLLSVPGFHEAMGKLITAPHEEIFSKPRAFVAFGWLMQAIAIARGSEGNKMRAHDRTVSPLDLSKVEGFTWTGSRKPYTFECSIENSHYVVQIMLNRKTRQPIIYLHEEQV